MEDEKCLVELDEILHYLSTEDLNKIPYKIRKAISENKDKTYKWKYDETKGLNEQNISRKTVAMLSYLNMEYLLDKEQKMLMEELHKYNEYRKQEEKREEYNPDNIFKNKQESVVEENSNLPMEIKKETFFKKLINFIKGIFNKSS